MTRRSFMTGQSHSLDQKREKQTDQGVKKQKWNCSRTHAILYEHFVIDGYALFQTMGKLVDIKYLDLLF